MIVTDESIRHREVATPNEEKALAEHTPALVTAAIENDLTERETSIAMRPPC